ncbi:hypothetical protein [Mycobacterium triplex]|nr:hypothetical protein [Mycobacterium triplex]
MTHKKDRELTGGARCEKAGALDGLTEGAKVRVRTSAALSLRDGAGE